VDRLYNKTPNTIHCVINGILADSGNINPIVVSSCILMEDERSETQVDGIVNKVNQ